MTAVREQAPRTPPRFVVRTFWLLHRAAYRLSGGGFGLSRPEAGSKFGMLRLPTIGRRSGQPRMLASMVVRQQASPTVKTQNHDDLVALRGLVETGKVTPVIDRTYPLTDTPEAIGHVAAGHTRGTVVITVAT